jgi:hypothetical protein
MVMAALHRQAASACSKASIRMLSRVSCRNRGATDPDQTSQPVAANPTACANNPRPRRSPVDFGLARRSRRIGRNSGTAYHVIDTSGAAQVPTNLRPARANPDETL